MGDNPIANNPSARLNFLDYLVKGSLATAEQIEEWKRNARSKNMSVIEIIEDAQVIKDDALLQAKSEAYSLPSVDLFGRVVTPDVLRVIPQEIATNYKIICFAQSGKEVSIGMVDPGNYKAIEAVEYIARENHYQVKYFIISGNSYKFLLRQYESLSSEVAEALEGAGNEIGVEVGEKVEIAEKGFEEVVRSAPVAKMVNVILEHAVEGKASDVHIEPLAEDTRVRYRIDGILHTSLILPKTVHSSIVARIKVLANLKIDETRVPQDGRFRRKFETGDVDFRVSTLPVVGNEKVVMRILDT